MRSVEVRKTCLLTRDDELMRKGDVNRGEAWREKRCLKWFEVIIGCETGTYVLSNH